MTLRSLAAAAVLTVLSGGLGGCGHEVAAPAASPTILASVIPAGGSTGVDPNGPIEVAFSHPMMQGMEAYAMLHEGDVTGPEVPGAWSWSDDRATLRFVPDAALRPRMQYTIHLGGRMMDEEGATVDMDEAAQSCGGQWATGAMWGGVGSGPGGMMGGAPGGMMGSGWQGANGSYGMVFTFTTA